jgi:hypothetical protein
VCVPLLRQIDADERACAVGNFGQCAVPFLDGFITDQHVVERRGDDVVALGIRFGKQLDLVRFRLRRDDLLLRFGVGDNQSCSCSVRVLIRFCSATCFASMAVIYSSENPVDDVKVVNIDAVLVELCVQASSS